MTNDMQTALAALRDNVEGAEFEWEGAKWRTVYLDNAIPDGWSGRKWAGILGALAKAGYYLEVGDDGFFGDVKL